MPYDIQDFYLAYDSSADSYVCTYLSPVPWFIMWLLAKGGGRFDTSTDVCILNLYPSYDISVTTNMLCSNLDHVPRVAITNLNDRRNAQSQKTYENLKLYEIVETRRTFLNHRAQRCFSREEDIFLI